MKKPKVGIVTYHRAINYGAVLQAYALNKKINMLGVTCDTIDYQCEAVDIQYNYRTWKRCTSWKNFIAHNLTCLLRGRKKKSFSNFAKQFTMSVHCDRNNIQEATKAYDVFITGSDQVFNPICHRNDPTFFLDFVISGSKNCYAASLGSIAQFESSSIDVNALLREFNGLSFREREASEYMEDVLKRKCLTVMDPVWFLNKEEWGKIALGKKKEPYIFVYNLMDYEYMRKYVRKLSKETGLPVVVTNRTIIGDLKYIGSTNNKSNCSPAEFLGYIRDAEYVITDSFHGTSLAILFEKMFCVALNPAQNNTNSRLHTILNLTGLQARTIDEDTLLCTLEDIDYGVVKSKIEDSVKDSELFLKSIIFVDT